MDTTNASHRFALRLLVFAGGLTTLGAELTASRLFAPFFGTSTIIWSVLIGLILVYLSVGYWIGGRWADRSPQMATLVPIVSIAALLVGLIPLIAAPVLRLSVEGFAQFDAGLLGGSFFGVLLLFTVPMILLGTISPFAIRLAVEDVTHAGRAAGQLYALSTLGSFVGSLLPSLWLLPAFGTRWTFWLLALALLAATAVAALLTARRALLWPLVAFGAVLAVALWGQGQPIKPGAGLIYEGESLYHYIRVVEENGVTALELNEGQGTHSIYQPGQALTGSVWDYYLLAPLITPPPVDPLAAELRWAIIGVAAGSTPRAIQGVYGDDPVVGVEIDGEIIAVARRYFALDALRNLDVVVDDGRTWLDRSEASFDVIGIDAYRQPYIPFHLTTVEFFTAARDHLTPNGVVAINVGRAPNDWRLVDALVTTMHEVFPTAVAIDVPDTYNTLLFASQHPLALDEIRTHFVALAQPDLQALATRAAPLLRVPPSGPLRFTDDRAPVEQVVDSMIARFALSPSAEP